MPTITPQLLRSINISFDNRFQSAFQGKTPILQPALATVTTSSTHANTYGFVTDIPRMREWISERHLHNLEAQAYTIANKDYELSIAVSRNDIEDDQRGLYNARVDMLGRQAAMWGDDRIHELLSLNGECYDGQPFFHTDHPTTTPNGEITQSNDFTSTPLNETNFSTVYAAMEKFVGADGQSLRITPNTLVVGPDYRQPAKALMMNEFGANGSTNTLRGMAEVVVDHGIPAGTWYLADTSFPIKPFVIQVRKAPEITMMTAMDDEQVFQQKVYRYGVDARGNAGYGLWFLMARATA